MTRRFVLSFLALTVFVLVVLIVPLGITAATRERDRLTLDLERDTRTIGAFAEDTLEGIADQDLQAAADRYTKRTGARALILNERGRVVADSDPVLGATNYRDRPEVAAALEGQLAAGTRRSDTLDTDLLYVAVPVASGGEVHGVVRLTYPTTAVDHRVRRVWLTLGGVAVVSLVAAGAIAVALARSVTRPAAASCRRPLRRSAGVTCRSMPRTTTGPPEVQALAKAFNDTSRRLEELMGAQDAFVADASHQLRTPLTALRLRLENLEAGAPRRTPQNWGRRWTRAIACPASSTACWPWPGPTGPRRWRPRFPVALGPVLEERHDIWLPVAEDRDVDLVVAPRRGLDGPGHPRPSHPGARQPGRQRPRGGTVRYDDPTHHGSHPDGPGHPRPGPGAGHDPRPAGAGLRPLLAGAGGHRVERPRPVHRPEAGPGRRWSRRAPRGAGGRARCRRPAAPGA